MKYALINGVPQEAISGAKGVCRGCGGELIAKCGSFRIHHWAHRADREGDSWWEPETEWHRTWKNHFPAECQEVVRYDERSGERHIADVRTHHGLVLEFQHSHLDPKERASREHFYGNMVWIVDGSRLKRDLARFQSGKSRLRRTQKPGRFLHSFPEECFPATWLDSSVPVIFDFRGIGDVEAGDVQPDTLWCLLPGRVEGHAVVIKSSLPKVVDVAKTRTQLLPVQSIMEDVGQRIRELRATDEAQRTHQPLPGFSKYWMLQRRRQVRF